MHILPRPFSIIENLAWRERSGTSYRSWRACGKRNILMMIMVMIVLMIMMIMMMMMMPRMRMMTMMMVLVTTMALVVIKMIPWLLFDGEEGLERDSLADPSQVADFAKIRCCCTASLLGRSYFLGLTTAE